MQIWCNAAGLSYHTNTRAHSRQFGTVMLLCVGFLAVLWNCAAEAALAPYQQDSGGRGLVSVEFEKSHANKPVGDHSWKRVSRIRASGASAMAASPNNGANVNDGYVSASPRLDFRINFVKTGVHYVWIRGMGKTGKDDSLHVGLNGAAVSTAARIAKFKNTWTWSRNTMDGTVAQIPVPSVGLHTVNLWMREDGMVADKLVLTTDATYRPKNTGPAESPVTGSLPKQIEATATTVTGESRFLDRPGGIPGSYSVASEIPTVDYVIYPTEDSGNRDHWTDGVVHSNGKVYTGIGDNGGINANSYIYEYDPATKRLRQVADLQSAVTGFSSDDWGFGKIHSRLGVGRDSNIYFASWWGKKGPNPLYRGDRVFHYDPSNESIHDHGIALPQWGAAGGRLNPTDLLYYLNAWEFGGEALRNRYLVFDLKTDQVILNQEAIGVGKNQCVDNDGNAYFEGGRGGALKKYDPKANEIRFIAGRLPGGGLTRCTRQRADGLMYIASGNYLVSLDPASEQVHEATAFMTETRAVALDPTERYIYYLAGTRSAGLHGVPLVQVDLEHGASQKVIAFLGDVLTNDLGYIPDIPNRQTLSMSLVIARDGRTVFLMLNGRQQDQSKGNVAFVAVHIPDGEAEFPEDI